MQGRVPRWNAPYFGGWESRRASCAYVEAAAVHVDGEPSKLAAARKKRGGEIARGEASDLRVAGRSAGLCRLMCVGKASFVLPTESTPWPSCLIPLCVRVSKRAGACAFERLISSASIFSAKLWHLATVGSAEISPSGIAATHLAARRVRSAASASSPPAAAAAAAAAATTLQAHHHLPFTITLAIVIRSTHFCHARISTHRLHRASPAKKQKSRDSLRRAFPTHLANPILRRVASSARAFIRHPPGFISLHLFLSDQSRARTHASMPQQRSGAQSPNAAVYRRQSPR